MNGTDEKVNPMGDVIWIIVGLGVVVAGYLLLQGATGNSSSGAGSVVLPSDAVQQAVIGAQVAEQQSSNTLAATISSNSTSAITSLAQANDALQLGLAQNSASVQNTALTAQSAVDIAQTQGQTAVNLGAIQANANDYVAATSAAASQNIAQSQASAAMSAANAQAQAETNAANAQAGAEKTAANDSIWSSLVGGVSSALGAFFSQPGQGTATVSDGSGPLPAPNPYQISGVQTNGVSGFSGALPILSGS